MTFPQYIIGTKEFVKAEVENSDTLDAQPVTIFLAGTEYTAGWVGSTATTRICRTTGVVDFTTGWDQGLYPLLVNFIDSPEEPLIDAGYVYVKNPG